MVWMSLVCLCHDAQRGESTRVLVRASMAAAARRPRAPARRGNRFHPHRVSTCGRRTSPDSAKSRSKGQACRGAEAAGGTATPGQHPTFGHVFSASLRDSWTQIACCVSRTPLLLPPSAQCILCVLPHLSFCLCPDSAPDNRMTKTCADCMATKEQRNGTTYRPERR